jgi:hypothetical protein
VPRAARSPLPCPTGLGTMSQATTATRATYAYDQIDQIDQARAELNAVSK